MARLTRWAGMVGGALVAFSLATPTLAGAAGAAAGLGASGRMLAVPGTSVRATTSAKSFNWSGYAESAATGTFTSVTDSWTVPTVNTSLAGSQYSSDWIGI